MCYGSILWDWRMNEVTTNRMTIVIIKVIITRSFVRCYQDHAVYYQLARSVCQKLMAQIFPEKGSIDEHMTPVIYIYRYS